MAGPRLLQAAFLACLVSAQDLAQGFLTPSPEPQGPVPALAPATDTCAGGAVWRVRTAAVGSSKAP